MNANKHNIAFVLMVIAFSLAIYFKPHLSVEAKNVNLNAIVPKEFGVWKELETAVPQIDLAARRDGEPSIDSPYDQTVMRTYVNDKGDVIMLALAYGKSQRQEVKIHRPELCYVAQGFSVNYLASTKVNLESLDQAIDATYLNTISNNRKELVLYWIRIGNLISTSAWKTRFYILKKGLDGEIVDGILVRTSQIYDRIEDTNSSLEIQKKFLSEMLKATPAQYHHFLIPTSEL
ncbi:exosortase C-terminal domain/associated protein EpsI [Methylobacillus methanolivorans]|uniref:Exosortase C-terminal domain/associated protein EpsI n=1 Tax=Methylobacillus methanolivorans TaxID=1848927 RepID=A0ABW8GH28_9PROT